MKLNFYIQSSIIFLFTTMVFSLYGQEKTQSHKALAEEIFQKLRLSDTEKTDKLIQATTDYLEILEILLEERSESLSEIDHTYSENLAEKDSKIIEAYNIARMKYNPAKKAFIQKLKEDLHPYQVDRIKDGLTKNAFPKFHSMYLEMVPGLKPIEKARILAFLVEGRENAMLAISDEGQKQWWDKYRGIINNYISSQGYDFGKLSKKWNAENADKEWVH